MATLDEMLTAVRLVSQAERLDNRLRVIWLDALRDETPEAARLENMRRKSLQRIDRRRNAYRVLVYGTQDGAT